MSDAGEALVDADARLQERMDERERDRRRRGVFPNQPSPERQREIQSLKLARTELQRQAAATLSPVRRQQIDAALEEIARRLADAEAG